MNMEKINNTDRTARRLTVGIIVLFILTACLCITTFALVRTILVVEDNYYKTGLVDISLRDADGKQLNDKNPLIRDGEFVFEPGATIVKKFRVQNESTDKVYYKVYFESVSGNLAEIVEVTLLDGDNVLYKGLACDMKRKSADTADEPLEVGESRSLEIRFRYPEHESNRGQAQILAFDLCTEAVQTKNNPNRLFE